MVGAKETAHSVTPGRCRRGFTTEQGGTEQGDGGTLENKAITIEYGQGVRKPAPDMARSV